VNADPVATRLQLSWIANDERGGAAVVSISRDLYDGFTLTLYALYDLHRVSHPLIPSNGSFIQSRGPKGAPSRRILCDWPSRVFVRPPRRYAAGSCEDRSDIQTVPTAKLSEFLEIDRVDNRKVW
jgi:hypothetical protein